MTGSELAYLDTYCERAGLAGLLAEPLNALSNLGFVIAALLVAKSLASVRHGQTIDLWALVIALLAIGTGSAIWHLVPTAHTVLMDIIPIALFINLYLLSALRRLLALPWRAVAGWWGAYFAAGLAARLLLPANLFNGSVIYAPTLIALALLALATSRRNPAIGRTMRLALGVWTISLLLRTADLAICANVPIGTHFLWHLLNSWVLWRLLILLIDHHRETFRRADDG